MTNHLSVVKNAKFIFTKFGDPFDFKPARCAFNRENRHFNGIFFLGFFFFAMFARIFEGNGTELTLGLFVVVIRVTHMNIHDKRCSIDNLKPSTLTGVINCKSKNAFGGCRARS